MTKKELNFIDSLNDNDKIDYYNLVHKNPDPIMKTNIPIKDLFKYLDSEYPNVMRMIRLSNVM